MNVHYEYRTTKATAATFTSPELARRWWNQWRLRNPAYAAALKLVKVTTIIREELV